MITIINEKSSQASDFAKALGGMSGTLPSNSTLANEPYQIVYAAGHLYEYKDLPDMLDVADDSEKKTYTSWDYHDLPFNRHAITWSKHLNPHTLGKGAATYMRSIKAALAKSDACVIATDLDPSGEGNLLGWEIVKGAGFKGKVYRCEHVDQSVNEVRKAFTHLKPISSDPNSPDRDGLLFKALAREKFDFLTIQYVRIVTDIARRQSVLPPSSIVREGRLKSAMIELVGHQQELHENFKPHSSFCAALFDQDGHKFLNKDAKYFNTDGEAQQDLVNVPQNATSKETGVEKLTRKPPKMLDLSSAGARLGAKGYSTKTVQDLAETMYQDEYLSYPRTEDKVITVEQLASLKPLIPDICQAIGVDPALIDPDNFRKSGLGHGSHGANRPGSKVPKDMDELKAKYGDTGAALYEEFARSFLAMMAPDKHLEKHNYADSETGKYTASATVVTDPGWGKVFDDSVGKDDNDDEDNKLYEIGSALKPGVYEKKASRPSLATMNSLIHFLDRNNIGTGATRLQTYNDIAVTSTKTRKLVKVSSKGSKLSLTVLGTISYLLMTKSTLASPKMTKNLEGYLNGVRDNKNNESQILGLFDQMFAKDKTQILANQKFLSGLTKYKTNTHKTVTGVYAPTGKELSFKAGLGSYNFMDHEVKDLFAGKDIIILYSGEKKLKCRIKLADRGKYGFGPKVMEWIFPKRPTIKGKMKDGTEVEFGKVFSGHTLTQDEANELLDGQAISFKAKKRTGGTYTAKNVKLIYGVPFGSKAKTKTWHLGFDSTGFKKKSYKKKHK